MLETKESPVDQDVNPSDMVHITHFDDPYTGLCGAKLRGIDADSEDVDCVVCVEIDAQEDWEEEDDE
jgi:hypothetical protein